MRAAALAALVVFAATGSARPAGAGDAAPVASPAPVSSPTPAVAPLGTSVPAGAWAVVDGKPIAQEKAEKLAKETGLPPALALDSLVQEAILAPRLERDGVPLAAVTEKDVEKALAEFEGQLQKMGVDLDQQLQAQGISRAAFASYRIRLGVAVRRRVEREATPEAVKAFFDRRRLELGGEVRARVILVSAHTRGEPEARARARSLLAQAGKEGASFGALARESSDDANAKLSGGDTDWFRRHGRIDEPIARAAFALGKKGLVPEPVRCRDGYAIVAVTGTREVETLDLDKLAPRLREQLIAERTMDLLEAWKADAGVVWAPGAPRVPEPAFRGR